MQDNEVILKALIITFPFLYKLYKSLYNYTSLYISLIEKRKRSDSILWQKPLHQQQCQKGKITARTMPQKVRLHSDCGST